MLPTHDVPCPHCGKPLYSSISLEDGVNESAPTAPRTEHDARGDFMSCPHCHERVEMQRVERGDAAEVQVKR